MKNKISFFLFALSLACSLGSFAPVSACSCVGNILPCRRFGYANEN